MGKKLRISIITVVMMLIVGAMCSAVYADAEKFTDEFYVISETRGDIAPGITDKRIIINTADGNRQNILYVCELDMCNETVGILAGFPDYDTTRLDKMDTPTNQAIAAEKATGENVVAAFNNNLFSLEDGTVLGTLIMNGKMISGGEGQAYFGVTADNVPLIGTYNSSTPALKEAVGGFRVLVKDGKMLYVKGDGAFAIEDYTNRNAVGIKEDGTVVYMVMEGKNRANSEGINTYEIAEIMVALGCRDVMQPDGGGSCTYAIQRPGSDKLVVENDPSYGVERKVSGTVLVTSSAAGKVDSGLTKCQKNGHTYTKTNSTVKCSVCKVSVKTADFSGLVTDKASGKKMFYINGVFQTGWTPVDHNIYYFNSKGLAEKVTVKATKKLECTNNGYVIYRCENAAGTDGKEYKVLAALMAPGHSYDGNKVCERCGWKEVGFDECTITTQYDTYKYTGKEIKPKVTIKANGKTLNSYYDYKITGYENNIDYGTGKIYVNTDFHNGTDLVYNSSSLERRAEPYVVKFQIKPAAVTNLTAKTVGTNSVKLSWKKTADAVGYRITKYNAAKGIYELKKEIRNPDTVKWTFKNMNAGKVHQYRVVAIAKDARGKTVKSNYKAVKVATKPYKIQNVRVSRVNKTSMRVKWNKRECTGYQIRYSTVKSFKNYNQVTLKGKANGIRKIGKLKTGKKYYVRVRAYTTVNNVKIFGAWSSVKSISMK